MRERARIFTSHEFEFTIENRNIPRIGRTVQEIREFVPLFQKAFSDNPYVSHATAYSAIGEQIGDEKFWRLALILELKEGTTKQQVNGLKKMVPKKIPVDIPIVYHIGQKNKSQFKEGST